jgi:hypothetical protein
MTDQIILDATPPKLAPPSADGLSLRVDPALGRIVCEGPSGENVALNAGLIGVPVHGVAALGTLTTSAIPANGATVTIGTQVYTFKTALTAPTPLANEVLIGISAAAALDNLKSAVNKTAGGGTTYAAATVIHPTVTATDNTDSTQLFVAKVAGVAGNAIATLESSAALSFGAVTLTGGVNCTTAKAGEIRVSSGFIYAAEANLTISSTSGWKRVATSALA